MAIHPPNGNQSTYINSQSIGRFLYGDSIGHKLFHILYIKVVILDIYLVAGILQLGCWLYVWGDQPSYPSLGMAAKFIFEYSEFKQIS